LVWIANGGGDEASHTTPVGPFLDLRSQSQAFSDIAAYNAFYGIGDKKIDDAANPERVTGIPVSFNFFSLLGVHPRLGRSFTSEECRANQALVVLSNAFWKRHFGSDPQVIGRRLILNGQPLTMIGVMPHSFDFGSIFAPGSRIDLFLPLPLTSEVDQRGDTLALIGRLKPGVTLRQAQAEAAVLSEPIRKQHSRQALRFELQFLEEHVRGRLRPGLLVLAFAVAAVMLIVCADLSNLQLARTAARQKEFAIRVALGAGRTRLLCQMLTESLVLSACGAVLGLLLAAVETQLVASLTSIVLPLRESIHLDGRALAFALLTALLTGITFGLVPGLRVRDIGVHDSLKDASRGSSEGKSRQGIRAMLVVSEIVFACVLVVAAGLLIRSFLRVLDVDLGFQPESAAVIRIDPSARYATASARNAYFDEALRAVRSIPGVTAAGLTDVLPFGHDRAWDAGRKDRVYSLSHPPPDAFPRIVSGGYFNAMGIPLRAGRYLTERDSAASKPVIVINETLAHILWPERDPIGQILIGTDVDREVVGVVGDVRHLALERGSGCEMYMPIRQTNDYFAVDLVIRTSLSSASLASAVRKALKPVEPNLPVKEFQTLQKLVDNAISPRRFIVLLLGGFSAFALVLGSLGITA
jgi:predicted permease